MKIKLSDILEALEFQSSGCHFFIHLKTGEVRLVSDEAIQVAEGSDGRFPDWQEEDVEVARDYLENKNDYLPVPSKQEVNEYQMMEDFAINLGNEKIKDQLLTCLKGKGAFSRFKNIVTSLGFDAAWYQFRNDRYKEYLIEWCKDNDIFLD